MGREVVRQLRAEGRRVRVLARKPRPSRLWEENEGVEYVRADITDADSLRGCCEGVEAVIHLVGIIAEVGSNTFDAVHPKATENILNEARQAGVGRFVHMSAINTRPDAPSRYHRSKWDSEGIVRRSGMAWTIFRPAMIYGKQDRFTSLIAMMLSFPFDVLNMWSFPVFGKGESRQQPIPVEDVARAFVRGLAARGTVKQTIDLVGPPLSFREMLMEISRSLGQRPSFIDWSVPATIAFLPIAVATHSRPVFFTVPIRAAEALALLLEKFSPVPVLTRDMLAMLQEDQDGDPEPARRLLGIHPKAFLKG